MGILWINLAVVFIFSFLARYFMKLPVIPNGTYQIIKPNKLFIFLVIMTLVLVSGLRANIGDTYFYKLAYEMNNFTWEQIKDKPNIGFWILQGVLKSISKDPQILIFTTAAITNTLIIIFLSIYSRLFELSTYVYITGGFFLVSMNGMRQTLTAAFLFAATKYIINGNWMKYFIVVLLASTFHESALILIPIYFIVRFKAWSKATFILLFLSILMVIGFDYFSKFLFSAIEESQYGHYSNFEEGGANAIRVFVYAIPLVIAYIGRDKMREIFPNSDFFINMALIGLVFMIISTQNWIFARFVIYFNLYQIVVLSWIVKLFRKKEQRFVYVSIIVCFFLYYYYESVISLDILYRSDYLSL